MVRDHTIVAAAAGIGALLAACAPGPFVPSAWGVGAGLSLAQALAGLLVYRAALRRRELALGPALGSGFLRIAVLLAALVAGILLGLPATPYGWALLAMYAAMMCAEVAVVSRAAQPVRQEVR